MRDGEELDDGVWKALGDPTRRRILDLLRDGARTTGSLCAAFPQLSRVNVIKHLGVLEAADLITVVARGRERWNHLNAVPIQRIYERWITPFEAHFASRLLDLQRRLETGTEPLSGKPPACESELPPPP